MLEKSDLLLVADEYRRITGLEDVTVSHRVFGDSKKLSAMRGDASITLDRFNEAFRWFSEHWPENARWPVGVPRPVSERAV